MKHLTVVGILGTIFSLVLIIAIAAAIIKVVRAARSTKKTSDKNASGLNEETESTSVWSLVKHPLSLITIGIIVFNWISYAMIPWFWDILTHTWVGFFAFNAGFWLVLYLRTVKIKDERGKETKEPNIAAYRIASIIMIMLAMGIMTTAYTMLKMSPKYSNETTSDRIVSPPFSNVPAEIALPVIAQCESGGKQFEADGTLVKNPTTSAIGKYGIMASLHEERAKKMGFDIRTEAGNEGYAKSLYAESGTKHWEADPRSKACWAPRLAGLGFGKESVLVTVNAPPAGSFSEIITVPIGFDVRWGESEDSFIIMNDRGKMAKYDRAAGILESLPPPSGKLMFQSLGDKAAVIRLRFSKL